MRKSIRTLISIVASSWFFIADLSSLTAQDVGWIDPTTAAAVLPYASMAQNAYGKASLDVQGWERVSDWKTIFKSAGRRDVKAIDSSGFSASIYVKKDVFGKGVEVAIAYRGTDIYSIADWRTNLQAWKGQVVPAQYRYAAELAALVQRQYSDVKRITLTGHSLAGAMATYAAQQNPKIAFNVVAFSPARVGIVSSVMPRGSSITNVIVPGEMVADEKTKSPAGFVSLPGKFYSVRSTMDTVSPHVTLNPITNVRSIARELINPHLIEGMVGGLRAAAMEASRAHVQVRETPNPAHSAPRPLTITQPQSVEAPNSRASTNEESQLPAPATTKPSTPSPLASLAPLQAPANAGPPPPSEKSQTNVPPSTKASGALVAVPLDPRAALKEAQKIMERMAEDQKPSSSAASGAVIAKAIDPRDALTEAQKMVGRNTGGHAAGMPQALPPATLNPNPTIGPSIRGPGGVSLSRAAAERMPLEIALDASALSDGKIVLSGRASKTPMDAALFLTALRVACDDRDPYFSLDPDDGALWSQQGDQASNEFWEKIKKDFPADAPARAKNAQPLINIHTVSATQDYPAIWHDISPHYPNFRSKLVFYPEWLRQTRLGEVLYKVDVLLKELSSGVSILEPGKLRASAIPGYLSADVEYAATSLLAGGSRERTTLRPQWRGSRLWFDIAPSAPPTSITIETATLSSGGSRLRSLLTSNGFIRANGQTIQDASFVIRHGNVFDLSQVNPRMFVRVHDPATNKDLSDHDPRLDGLAMDVSGRFDQYAKFYDELRLLRDIVRGYIAARKVTDSNERLCDTLNTMPLLDSEKIAKRLPDYHASELFVTIAKYSMTSKKGSQTQFVRTSSMNGGVSISGQRFAETAMRDGETTVTRAVAAALAGVNLDQPDAIDSDRKFISFIVDDGSGAPVRLASNARDPLAPRSLSDYPIENEPVARANPFARQSGQGQGGTELVPSMIGMLLALLTLGLIVNYLIRKRPIGRS